MAMLPRVLARFSGPRYTEGGGMPFDSPSQVTELTQELRLATTMTGGVSLAVWMAGVAREINLLAQASQWRRSGGHFPAGTQLSAPSVRSPEQPYGPSTTLYVTTTLLNGETSRFTDSFGTLVQDVDRRGLFTFTEKDLAKKGEELAEKQTVGAVALAAR